MPLGIMAGIGLLGDVMSYSGQQSANQMNQSNMIQNEQWQEHMSDTAVQRRADDLKAANLNPMLAVGNPASTPGISAPNIQNPMSSFSQLGQQATSAVATKAQANLADAQAANVEAHTNSGEISAQVEQIKSATGVNTAMAQKVQAEVNFLNSTMQWRVDQSFHEDERSRWQDQQAMFEAHMKQVDVEVQAATKAYMIKATNDANLASSAFNTNKQGVEKLLGIYGSAAERVYKPVTSAAGAILPYLE